MYSTATFKETFDQQTRASAKQSATSREINNTSIQSGHFRQFYPNHQITSPFSTPTSSISSTGNSVCSYDSYNIVDPPLLANEQTGMEHHHHHQHAHYGPLSESSSPPGKTTWIMAAFLLINAALGAGLLNYPVAYDRLGGIFYATLLQCFAAILMISTIMVLVYCAQIHNEDSYHGVMRTMCGPGIMQLSAASIAITCFGICITFIIIIGDQFDRIFATYIGLNFCTYWYFTRYFSMSLTAILATWPMCYFRRLDFLRHINVLGVLASLYIIFLNIYSYYYYKPDSDHLPDIRTSPKSLLEFVAALPVIFFAYQTHEIVIPVYDSMSTKNIRNFSKSVITAMLSLLILYCVAGSFGYLTFGSKVAPDIMLMYDANDSFVLAGIIALIVKMITTYPPVVFCGRDTIVRLILSRYNQLDRNGYQCLADSNPPSPFFAHEHRCNIIITTIWNILVLIFALLIPNITIAIGFLGSLASCNVFIFPGLALIILSRRYLKIYYHTNKISNNKNSHHRNNNHHSHNKHRHNHRALEQQPQQRTKFFTLSDNAKHWMYYGLQLYGLFIIAMGVIMFIIILIQVYHDFHQPMEHGAVCDSNLLHNAKTNST